MKKHLSVLLAGFLMLLAILPATSALAQAGGPALHLEQVDITEFPQVTVHLSAWDVSGLPLAGLAPEDFTLQEDGGTAFHPASLQEDANAPLSVVLVLDISGSMGGQPLLDAKQAAARFLDRLQSGDRAALLAFSDKLNPDPQTLDPAREMAFTADLAPMYDLITGLQADGETHLFNVASKAVRMSAGLPQGHRAVLLLSDGVNEPANVGDAEEAILLAQEAGVPVFVIGLGSEIDETYLRRLANETGGMYRSAPKSSELASLFTDMATLLKTQYILTYASRLAADGQAHTLAVTLNTPAGSAVATMNFGPLPLQVLPTSTLTPQSPAASEPPPATSLPDSTGTKKNTSNLVQYWWGWLLALLIAVGLVFWLSRRNRRPRLAKEVCGVCGFELTGKPGACPKCHSTKRLPKP